MNSLWPSDSIGFGQHWHLPEGKYENAQHIYIFIYIYMLDMSLKIWEWLDWRLKPGKWPKNKIFIYGSRTHFIKSKFKKCIALTRNIMRNQCHNIKHAATADHAVVVDLQFGDNLFYSLRSEQSRWFADCIFSCIFLFLSETLVLCLKFADVCLK